MNRTLQIWNDLRPFSVGFDNLFDHFDMHLAHQKVQTFPPYNIKKIDDFNWQIEMALAGFSKKDISVETANGQLKIQSVDNESESKNDEVIHRGISKRKILSHKDLLDLMRIIAQHWEEKVLTLLQQLFLTVWR